IRSAIACSMRCAGSRRSMPPPSPRPRWPAAPPGRRSAGRSRTPASRRFGPWQPGRRRPAKAPPSPDSQETADRQADQADQHAAGQRDEPDASAEAKAQVAGKPAETELLEPWADRVEDDQGEKDDDEPADHDLMRRAALRRRREVSATGRGERPGMNSKPAFEADAGDRRS